MGFQVVGQDNITVANVTADGLCVALPAAKDDVGFNAPVSEIDAGTVTGSRSTKALESDADFRLRVGVDSTWFSESFPGVGLNSALWTAPVATMTVTVVTGFVNLNAGLSIAIGEARVSSYRSFPIYQSTTTEYAITAQLAQLPQANNVTEWGAAIAVASAPPTDGAVFRLNALGELRCVVIANSVELQSLPLNFATLIGPLTTHQFLVSIADSAVSFWIDNVLVARIALATAGYTAVASPDLPVLLRTYNTSATVVAQVLRASYVGVAVDGLNITRAWPDVRSGAGDAGYQGSTGGVMGSTALYANSLAAGAGVAATNTTAALGSGLGGQFSLRPTLAVPTDGIISSYQVPAGTAAVPGKSLVIKGVRIQGVVTTALTGGPVLGAWSLAFGSTAVSLVTVESATTKAPRRIPLGIQVFAVTAPVGARDDREVNFRFDCPVVVQPGEFVQTVLKNLGTVAATGVITFLIAFDSHWE